MRLDYIPNDIVINDAYNASPQTHEAKKLGHKKANPMEGVRTVFSWCRRRDLNPHARISGH